MYCLEAVQSISVQSSMIRTNRNHKKSNVFYPFPVFIVYLC
uniref:Uncharacterized protein n=1 Tax=Anguilla anguilla TaxID=7936 RepID=A0A0E9PKH6_ANGAN